MRCGSRGEGEGEREGEGEGEGEGAGAGAGEERRRALIKSNNPHLAGGELNTVGQIGTL